ncbi:lipase secretion chaperone [Arenicella xantha]|uniref:Lipase chaperone n=1 Tax=Arenicella xantha TaxID=644221 RepID=A0A395JJ18_9GAMM|nr:lipase secretion chaperone [Arenicella xantha]RBP50681.1 lipase chaperone protein [Arenicella xantha]
MLTSTLRAGGFYLLIGIVCWLVAHHYRLHHSSFDSETRSASQAWLQPRTLDEKYPEPVGSYAGNIDFYAIEKLLWKVQINPSGALTLGPETAEILHSINRYLPDQMVPSDYRRLALLTAKIWPDTRSVEIAPLLRQYNHYRSAYRAGQSKLNSLLDGDKYRLLQTLDRTLEQQQQDFFGHEQASALFSQRNITTHYLNQRRLIQLDPSLTKAQKVTRLNTLRQEYQTTRLARDNSQKISD